LPQFAAIQAVAPSLRVEVNPLNLRDPAEIERAVAAWPLVAGAQQPERMRRIGILLATTADDAEFQAWVGAFRSELSWSGECRRLYWQIGRSFAGSRPSELMTVSISASL
jgi:hypothetical protein